MGIIDTSKWQATNGNQVSQQPQSIASTNGQLMPPNGNVNGLKLASSATDWSNSTSPFNGNRVRRIPSLYFITEMKHKKSLTLTTIIMNYTQKYI